MKAIRNRWLAFLLLIVAAEGALAQSAVESRVQQLEETIRVLERRVAELEVQLRERITPAPTAPDKVNWRKLQRGMTEGEVERLLGSPSKVDAIGPLTNWYYGNAEGRVQFNDRRVFAWREP